MRHNETEQKLTQAINETDHKNFELPTLWSRIRTEIQEDVEFYRWAARNPRTTCQLTREVVWQDMQDLINHVRNLL